jgi:4-diphosphocytidyl-2-C-methyl-D-erythritol kinase
LAIRVIRARAFAKINLSLRVLGVRPDGYHELRTIFQSIALHDTLTIRAARGVFVLECDDAACPGGRDNLVWHAVARVWRASGRHGLPHGLAAHLVKRIPMRAGLGGGSSDAAAAIRALARLWRVDAGRQRLIAAALGADVPFFLEGGTVLGLERGDLLFPLVDSPRAWVVLALPPFGVSTKDAFAWCDEDGSAELEGPVSKRHPEIRRLVSALRRAGASSAAMSGSGSAVFGLFGRRDAAARVHAAFARASAAPARRFRAILTRTMSRREYQRLAAK